MDLGEELYESSPQLDVITNLRPRREIVNALDELPMHSSSTSNLKYEIPGTFSDQHDLDPHSSPDIDYPDIDYPEYDQNVVHVQNIKEIKNPKTYTIVKTPNIPNSNPEECGSVCEGNSVPWPTIIISILGAVVVIYTAVAPNVDNNRRVFGVVLMLLWTIVWALILWVLWKDYHRPASWWLLLIPVIIMALFFILIIVMNVGASI